MNPLFSSTIISISGVTLKKGSILPYKNEWERAKILGIDSSLQKTGLLSSGPSPILGETNTRYP